MTGVQTCALPISRCPRKTFFFPTSPPVAVPSPVPAAPRPSPARFRIKKKQREAALESTAKELRDKVAALERDVDTLRTENGWLRGLIVGCVRSRGPARGPDANALPLCSALAARKRPNARLRRRRAARTFRRRSGCGLTRPSRPASPSKRTGTPSLPLLFFSAPSLVSLSPTRISTPSDPSHPRLQLPRLRPIHPLHLSTSPGQNNSDVDPHQ